MNRKYKALLGLLMIGAITLRANAETPATQPVDGLVRAYDPAGSYVVAVSKETLADAGWAKVVAALRSKHNADLVVYPRGQLGGVATKIAELFPRYICFVTTSEEAGRDFVVQVNRLTRKLDSDPYTDAVWGIVTGLDSDDALRIAKQSKPLIIQRAASSMGPGIFSNLQGGFASAETKKDKFFYKDSGGKTIEDKPDPDALAKMADYFNNNPPDLFLTSGHATERDWQTYYNIPGGSFRCDRGQLYALDSNRKRYDIQSPNPKIYLPAGNCLIGHVTGPDCMAIAWMHTGGVHQMAGYTAVTFFGYMGWGTSEAFGDPWNFAEATYFTNQSLIYELNTKYPEKAEVNFDTYSENAINKMAAKYKLTEQKQVGMLWDRDIFAFYGDPAWIASLPKERSWKYSFQQESESVTVTVEALKEGGWPGKPIVVPFPHRLQAIRSITCDLKDVTPAVTDNFLVLPLMKQSRKAGDKIVIAFGARNAPEHATSANSPAVEAVTPPPPSTTAPTASDDKPDSLNLSPDMAISIGMAMQAAGENRRELSKVIETTEAGEQRDDVLYLIANMPLRDLQALSADYLTQTVSLARKAREQSPWGKKYDDAVFRNDVLPYASITEPREDWRGPFFDKFITVVKDCATAGEAAIKLNQTIFKDSNVVYNMKKRARPDEGPLATIKSGFATCTGLSVMLVDACRSVGIPARIAGVAQWGAARSSGNHTWVEIRDDDGQWYAIGASESKALNSVWFAKSAAKVDESIPMCHIYATSFTRQPLKFPMVWNPYADYVSAVDRTAFYKKLETPANP